MKKYLAGAIILVLCFLVCSLPGISLAQEEEGVEYSSGTVSSVSSGQIVIAEYDYSSSEDVDVTYTIDSQVKLENVNSLADIAVGNNVDIAYVIRDGKRVAMTITVEKAPAEEEYYPEEEEEIEY